jgi:hypothetical protein
MTGFKTEGEFGNELDQLLIMALGTSTQGLENVSLVLDYAITLVLYYEFLVD